MVVDINNSKIFVWLSNSLLNDLKLKITEHNENSENDTKLNLEIAAYFVNLPNYIGSIRKDQYEDGWIPICSEIYRNIKNFSKYFDFLVSNEFLLVHSNNYSTATGSCKRYKLGKKYNNQALKFFALDVNTQFYNKRLKYQKDRLELAKNKNEHLTKWLDTPDLFDVDYTNALNCIRENFKGKKRKFRTIAIDNFKQNIVRYSREGKDNRLHTILTSLPKDLRSFITYDNQKLASIDITNCQPFILASILDTLISNRTNRRIEEIKSKYIPNMFDPIQNREEIREFINEITSGGYYYSLGDKLYKGNAIMTNCSDNYYFMDYHNEKSKGNFKIKEFENRREAAKHVMMKILFTDKGYNNKAVSVFKSSYPEVYKILNTIKSKGKSNLPILLQNIEADFILDYCTKNISTKFPNMPLFTIHDSIITTEENIELLEEEFRKNLANYFQISPALKVEFWNNNLNELNKAS